MDSRGEARAAAVLIGLALALGMVAVWLWITRAPPVSHDLAEILKDPEMRARLIERLATESPAYFDSHPDPDVGHVLLPGRVEVKGEAVPFNRYGMREVPYELPKPEGTVRIVLLGDSFVFGWRVRTEERLGALLQRHIAERVPAAAPRIEVLHLGVTSWNTTSQCAFVRRQLAELAPDLVLQICLANDLDDAREVRGFGGLANFSSSARERADAVFLGSNAVDNLGVDTPTLLFSGFGHESRTRFARMGASLTALKEALSTLPAKPRHVLIVNWTQDNRWFHRALGREQDPAELAYLPKSFWRNEEYHFGPSDAHWNPNGHAKMARVLYGLIRARGYLALELAPWPEAEEESRTLLQEGWDEVLAAASDDLGPPANLLSSIETASWTKLSARAVLGGIDRDGLVSPYASVLLRIEAKHRELHLAGRFLPDPVLGRAQVQVRVEEFDVGTLHIEPGAELDFRAGLPPGLAAREAISVTLSADDYVYRGAERRHCVVFQLERLALE